MPKLCRDLARKKRLRRVGQGASVKLISPRSTRQSRPPRRTPCLPAWRKIVETGPIAGFGDGLSAGLPDAGPSPGGLADLGTGTGLLGAGVLGARPNFSGIAGRSAASRLLGRLF